MIKVRPEEVNIDQVYINSMCWSKTILIKIITQIATIDYLF